MGLHVKFGGAARHWLPRASHWFATRKPLVATRKHPVAARLGKVETKIPRRHARATLALIATSALVALSASAPQAAPARTPMLAHALRAELVSPHAPAFSLTLAPHVAPLRVPDRRAYAASKAAAAGSYLRWLERHPQAQLQAGAKPGAASTSTPAAPPPRAVLFEELNDPGLAAGGPFTKGTPPDTTGAIGPNDYVEFVNAQVAVYDRARLALRATMGEDEFTGGSATCDGQIRWDQQAERWEYASLDCLSNGTSESFTFGWSKTSDPTDLSSGWCKYHVNTEKILFDYPKLGGDNDFMLIGANGYEILPAEKYVGSAVFVIAKPPQGVSTCPPIANIPGEETPFTPVPANIYGSSTTGYVVAGELSETEAKNLALFTVTKSSGGEPEFHRSNVPVSGYFMPAPVPQPGTTDGLDSSDTRLTQAVAAEDPTSHKMAVWTQHTVAPAPGVPSVVRWYELTAGPASLVQEGTVKAASLGDFAFNGAISPTARGNGAAIDYNVGGPTLAAELRAQSRAPTAPAGTMGDEVKLAESEAADKDFSCPSSGGVEGSTSCRWGDYAGASPDPLHPAVVWGTGEVSGPQVAKNGAQWKTENFALTLRHETPVALFSVTTAFPMGGAPVSFDASASSDPVEPIVAYEWSFGDGMSGTGEKPAHVYAHAGTYHVRLTVMDDGGLTSTVEHEVAVADAPPIASFGVNGAPTAGAPVNFDASASHDPDGTIVSYGWSFGDGTNGTGEAPTHTYAIPGAYAVKLTIVDNAGLSASVERTIAVAPPSNTASSVSSTTTTTTPITVITVIERMITVTPPSNVVIVKGKRQNKKTGTLALTLLVPGPGVLSVRDASNARNSHGLLARLASALGMHADRMHADRFTVGPSAAVAKSKGKAKHRRKPTPLIKPVSMTVSQGGTVTLQIVPTPAGRTRLNRVHKLAVRVLIAFTPTGGTQGTLVVTARLSKTPAKHKHK